jgi:nitrous oxidase accessory protein NosD
VIALIQRKLSSSLSTGPGRKRLLLAVCIVAAILALVLTRPWHIPEYDCAVTVRPGESIQAAIDAAEAGDVICLARGEWTEGVVIDKSLTLVGRGTDRTVIGPCQYNQPVVQVLSWSTEPVSVQLNGLSISADRGYIGVAIGGTAEAGIRDSHVSGMHYGVQVMHSAHLTFTDCTVSDSRQTALLLLDSAEADITGSHVSANRGPGLMISRSAGVTLRSTEVSRNGGDGLIVDGAASVTVIDSLVSGNGRYGLWLTGQSQAELLRSDVSENSNQGIRAENRATVSITDSALVSNWHGIHLTGTTQATVADTNMSSNRFDGIRVEDSAHATVSDSVLSSNARGASLRDFGTANMEDCVVESNEHYGLFSGSSGKAIGGANRFRGNGIDLGGNLSAALRLPLVEPVEAVINWPDERFESLQEAIDALLPGGRLMVESGTYATGLTIGTEVSLEAAQEGVVLISESGTLPVLSLVDGADLHLAGITISGGSTGLSLASGATAALEGCTVTANTQGVYLSYSSSVDMMDCDVVANAESGIFAVGASRATMTRCSVSDHSDYGIGAANSARLTIIGSVLTRCGWDGAIILWDRSQAVIEGNTIIDNRGYGVAIHWHQCFQGTFLPFEGHISGRGNTFDTNWGDDICPPELEFLATPEGGELDYRPASSP